MPACVCTMCPESARAPATGAVDGCELPCGFWESNPGPLEEQPTLLTAEPFLQPPETSLLKSCAKCVEFL